jgi:hypothetical protein
MQARLANSLQMTAATAADPQMSTTLSILTMLCLPTALHLPLLLAQQRRNPSSHTLLQCSMQCAMQDSLLQTEAR